MTDENASAARECRATEGELRWTAKEAQRAAWEEVGRLAGPEVLEGVRYQDWTLHGSIERMSALKLLSIVEAARDRLVEKLTVELLAKRDATKDPGLPVMHGCRVGLEVAARAVGAHHSTPATEFDPQVHTVSYLHSQEPVSCGSCNQTLAMGDQIIYVGMTPHHTFATCPGFTQPGGQS